MKTKLSVTRLIVGLALGAASLTIPTAHADILRYAVWFGGNDRWSSNELWSTGVYPRNVVGTNFVVMIDNSNPVSSIVTQDVSVTIDALYLEAGEKLYVANGRALVVTNGPGGGIIVNAGVFEVAPSASFFSGLGISGGTFNLTGGGTISLNHYAHDEIWGASSNEVLVNVDNTIVGSGNIGANLMGLDNRATITANQATELQIDPSAAGVVNSGLLQATNGALLQLRDGVFTNTLGTIRAANASTVEVYSATIIGGLLTTEGSGAIRANGTSATLQDIQNTGLVLTPNQDHFILSGTITNAGTFEVHGTSGDSGFIVSNGVVTLTGGGTVSVGDYSYIAIVGATANDVLVNVHNTIAGSGRIGANKMGLDNRATITANQSYALEINPSAAGVVNSGVLQATDGAMLQLRDGIFSNSLGTIRAANASTVEVYNTTIIGGLLTTEGSGAIRPSAPGTLQDVRNTGVLLTPNQDHFILSGTISNAGTFQIPDGTSGNSGLIISNGVVTLAGGGTVSLGNNNGARILIVGATANDVLVNVDNTIVGSGTVGANLMGLDNRGTIIANQANVLTINPTDSIGLINRGTLQANAGSTLYVSGAGFSNFVAATSTLTGGTYRVAGTLKFDNASLVNNASTILLDGAAATIVNQSAFNALTAFTTNTGAGSFILTNGASFATGKPFVNLGSIQLPTGGVMAGYSNIVNGDIACSAPATIDITGGSLFVTNTSATAVLEVRSGTLTLSAGLLAVDKLVVTNSCARFIQSGGTLETDVVILPPGLDADGDGLPNGWEQQYNLDPFDPTGKNGPNADPDGDGFTNLQEYNAGTDPTDSASLFAITAIAKEANNIRVTWLTGSGKTNALQRSGNVAGGYADIFTVTNAVSSTTNYLDIGAATNKPALFYRVRLVP